MTPLQKLMTVLAMNSFELEQSITPTTKYEFYVVGMSVWIKWNDGDDTAIWGTCNDFRMAELTAKMLNYAAYCMGCSSLETCPTI